MYVGLDGRVIDFRLKEVGYGCFNLTREGVAEVSDFIREAISSTLYLCK